MAFNTEQMLTSFTHLQSLQLNTAIYWTTAFTVPLQQFPETLHFSFCLMAFTDYILHLYPDLAMLNKKVAQNSIALSRSGQTKVILFCNTDVQK